MGIEKDIVDKIIQDLCSRKGLGDEWDAIDDDDETRNEIRTAWEKIVLEEVAKGYFTSHEEDKDGD